MQIISDINEPGTIALNSYQTVTGNENIYIIPDGTTLRTILGAVDNAGLIRLQNTRNVIIDGSYNGAGRYLKFKNVATVSVSVKGTTFQLLNTLGANAKGCRNIKILNSIIMGTDYEWGTITTERYAIYAGDSAMHTGSNVSMSDHDSITIENNMIYHSYQLIYSSAGDTSRSNDYWLIKDNLFAGAALSDETNSSSMIYLAYTKYNTIDGNTCTNMSTRDDVRCIYLNNYNNYAKIINNRITASYSSYNTSYGISLGAGGYKQ